MMRADILGVTSRALMDFAGSHWESKQLTYNVTKYPSGLKSADVDRELARAARMWADVTELSFTHSSDQKVDIEIRY